MADLFDYLIWRGDVPLTLDPFNEVDNLLLSELAYADLAGIVPPDGKEIPIAEVSRLYAERLPRESAGIAGKAARLFRDMAEGARFSPVRLGAYVNEIDPDRGCQFSAVTFLLPDETAFIAYRGTDGTVVGWKEDFALSYAEATAGQREAAEYLRRAAEKTGRPLRVGGHSKGGHFAVYAAACCGEEAQRQILEIYSNDGPGFREQVLLSPGYQAIVDRTVSIVPDGSVIGMLMDSACPRRVVRSSALGIGQHDGFTWQVERNRFVPAALSQASVFMDKTLDGWLAGMDDETRRATFDTLFSVLSSTGEETFRAMNGQKLKTAEAILTALRGLPREKQQALTRSLGQLLQSGGQTAAELLVKREQGKGEG